MRRFLPGFIAVFSFFSAVHAARAADMPVKAPAHTAPLAAAYNWTGFYAGGNVGYGWGHAKSDVTLTLPTFLVGNLQPTIPDSAKPNGIIGGGQIGFNWQPSPTWMLGVEADWQGAGQKGSSVLPPQPTTGLLGAGTVQVAYDAKIAWFGTVRGRIGYAFDRFLVYATGGLAYGEVKIAGSETASGTVVGIPYSASTPFGDSKINAGWTLGGGIEMAIAGNWSLKAEYLYLDLGSLDTSSPGPLVPAGPVPMSTHTRFTDNIVRVGLNYRFGAL